MKESHFITPKLLEALGGKKKKIESENGSTSIIEDGAYLWGIEDEKKGAGIFNHVMLTSRIAYCLAEKLKNSGVAAYENINLQEVVHAAILHDLTKLHGEDCEKLNPQQKEIIGIPTDYSELATGDLEKEWLKKLDFDENVIQAIQSHDFPEKIINNPYWKIILLADYMSGQKIMTVEERLEDIKKRWIDEQISKGLPPRINTSRFDTAKKNIEIVAREIFEILNTFDYEFITENNLNSDDSAGRWEKFLRRWRPKGKRAKRLVDHYIKNN